MLRRKRVLYGWRIEGTAKYCLSRYPPDLPQLPVAQFASIDAAELTAETRKAVVVWCGAARAEKQRQPVREVSQQDA